MNVMPELARYDDDDHFHGLWHEPDPVQSLAVDEWYSIELYSRVTGRYWTETHQTAMNLLPLKVEVYQRQSSRCMCWIEIEMLDQGERRRAAHELLK